MIILSNKKLDTNSILKQSDLTNNFLILKKSELDKNHSFFLFKILVDFNEEITYLVDDLYTIAYDCKILDSGILILKKVSMTEYLKSILDILIDSHYDFRCYKSSYTQQYITYNPEIKKDIISNLDTLLRIFKEDIKESIYSSSDILSVIKLLDIQSESFLKELGKSLKDSIDKNNLYTKNTLLDLIELTRITDKSSLIKLEKELDILLKEEESDLPFVHS